MRISQREARRLRKRVAELEGLEYRRRRAWASEWPHGTEIAAVKLVEYASVPVSIRVARRLNHAVVCTVSDDGTVRFIALPLAEKSV